MATEKQKREAALAKREQRLKEEMERGLAAQKAEQDHRAQQKEAWAEKAREINARYNAILARHGIHE